LLQFAPKRWHCRVVFMSGLSITIIGASRVVIGVHFPGDVVGGFASGATWLVASIGILETARAMARRKVPLSV
jgi:undecaprenyl-diphosphatase